MVKKRNYSRNDLALYLFEIQVCEVQSKRLAILVFRLEYLARKLNLGTISIL